MADKVIYKGQAKQNGDDVIFDKSLIKDFNVAEIQSISLGINLFDFYQTMRDNTEIWVYTYASTTQNGWPETNSNNNLCRLTRINANYGFAKCWIGYHGYESRVNASGIQGWKKITP